MSIELDIERLGIAVIYEAAHFFLGVKKGGREGERADQRCSMCIAPHCAA